MNDIVAIDELRFNDDGYIENRAAVVPQLHQGALRSVLRYLYSDDGPLNLPRKRLLAAELYLGTPERFVARWLYTRTNGSLRKTYGAMALRAARASKYRCEVCGFADVRVLNLDHVQGRVAGTPFSCLCANCHTIKSRAVDWTGLSPIRESETDTVPSIND